jgi:hypothetical protein
MRVIVIILLFLSLASRGQDKIFMRDGTSHKGVILSMGNEFIFFRLSDTSKTNYKIPKYDILMIEKQDGRAFIYKTKNQKADTVLTPVNDFPLNYFGIQPLGLFIGRATLCYERLNKKGTVGFVFPLTITYDPVGLIYESTDSSFVRNPGVNFIGGADINFYLKREGSKGFFIGPRIRYGTDMFLENIEAYSLQTQFGWYKRFGTSPFYQHISFGIGFARVLSSQAGNRINPKQSYGWGSINYRISFGR